MGRARLTKGNKKVHGLLFSLPPIKSCLNCILCRDSCYAVKAYRQYKATRALWDDNFKEAKENLYELFEDIVAQLRIENRYQYVRIHQSGDFFSQAYIDMWISVAKMYPDYIFYYYTKVDHLFDFSELEKLENAVGIPSILDGQRNYGTMEYVSELSEKTGAVICPATIEKGIRCGIECHQCMIKGAKVVFVQH